MLPPFPVLFTTPFVPEARALFARFTTQPTFARKVLINNLIKSLKTVGVWTKLDALYLLAAADAQAARQNWVQDLYNCTAVSAPTFTADRGYAGDGSGAYLNTNFNPTTAASPKFVQNSGHIALWDRTERAGANTVQMGSRPAGAVFSQQNVINTRLATTNNFTGRINGITSVDLAVTTNAGLSLVTRTGANDLASYRNGSVAASSAANASDGLANASIIMLARMNGITPEAFTTDQLAFGSIGSGLTAQNASDLYAAINTYLQAVGAA